MNITLGEVISRADELKPNAFSKETKIGWINTLEGKVQTSVWLLDHTECVRYSEDEDMSRPLLVAYPYDDVYVQWFCAQIDFANGEYDLYANTCTMFNKAWGEYVRWFAAVYSPAQGYDAAALRPRKEEV